jgi:signal transduction histidine kinase
MRSPPRQLLWPALAAVGIVGEAIGFGLGDPSGWVPDLLTGWLVAGAGLVAWDQRPRSLAGPLLVATGVLWFAGDLSAAFVYAYRGPLLHLTLTYPSGRPRGRVQAFVVICVYVAAAIAAVWRSEAVTIVLSSALVAVAAVSWWASAGRERRERAYALRATGGVASLLATTAVFRLAVATPTATDASLLVFEAALAALAIALVGGLLRAPWARAGATDLVVELADTRSGALRDQLARALGDGTLEVGFPVAEGGGFTDVAGRPLSLPDPGSQRRATVVQRGGLPVAVLIHDAAVLSDPGLEAELSEAAQMGLANARLQAEVRAQIAELQASRRRLVAAADDERRRLEQRLQETAERRLTLLLPDLEEVRRLADGDAEQSGRVDRLGEQLEHSLADLRRLAAGLHPRELVAGGLMEALRALASRSPVPVDLELALPERVPGESERAAYFVCSEGLANIVKYADATRVRIVVRRAAGRLRVEVADDGRGGADPDRGSGLRGLADRVEALGGGLEVDSPPGAGTCLVAELPLRGPS